MPTSTMLDIRGYSRYESVPNSFFRQDGAVTHLALIFPGFGYRATMPLLYYPERILAQRGADVLRVEYLYDTRSDFQSMSKSEQDACFRADVEAAAKTALAQRAYQRVTLIGKSIGTLALGHLMQKEERLRGAEYIWITPLLRQDRPRAQIVRHKPRSLFLIGTADSHYDVALLDEVMQASGGQAVVIEGGNHSLEIPGSILESVRAMERIVQGIESFLDSAPGAA